MSDVIEQIYSSNKFDLVSDKEAYDIFKNINIKINCMSDDADLEIKRKFKEDINNLLFDLVEYVDRKSFKKALRLGSEIIHYTLFDDNDN